MSNIGNQFGYLCPNCGKGTELLVSATAHLRLMPHGLEIDDASLLDSSAVVCLICGWEGTVGDLAAASFKKGPGSERVVEKFRKEK
jgi:hypothetical protein